jgi:putative ABC transport system ATP-binding protein
MLLKDRGCEMEKAKGIILIVDDEESIRDLLSTKLKADGYDCEVAADGNEALWKSFMKDFDIVLLDIKMPGLSGMEVLSRIVIDHPDTSVVIVTAVLDTKMAVEAMRQGAYDYVTKPFNLDDLGARIKRALEKRRLVLENKEYYRRLNQKIKQLEERGQPSQHAELVGPRKALAGQESTIKFREYSSPVESPISKTSPLVESATLDSWGHRSLVADRAMETMLDESQAPANPHSTANKKSPALDSSEERLAITPNLGSEIIVRLENVSRTYRMGQSEVKALKNVTLDIALGEFIVILGPSGSGKTTLLNIIGGIDSPSSGSIRVNGIDISALDDKGLTEYRRNQIGFVFQSFNLIPTLTAKENVEFAAELVKAPKNAPEVLEMVGLKERTDHYPSELSGGEQQRVAIARALVKNPPILLCDEPTGELDCETGKFVLSALRMINKMERKTVLIVTHNAIIGDMAHKVIRLRSGELFEIETNPSPTDPLELRW